MLSRPRPRTRTLTIVAQDPSVKHGNRVLTTEVEVPAEELTPGPRGYRVHVWITTPPRAPSTCPKSTTP